MSRMLLIAVACALGGCAAYKAPKLTVRDARIMQSNENGVVIEFRIDAENTNKVELPLKSVNYQLFLNGEKVFQGVRSPEATLRRLGTQTITLPAVINIEDEAAVLNPPIRYRLNGRLTYITPGSVAEILFDAGVRRPKVRFRSSGALEFEAESLEEIDAGAVGTSDLDVDP